MSRKRNNNKNVKDNMEVEKEYKDKELVKKDEPISRGLSNPIMWVLDEDDNISEDKLRKDIFKDEESVIVTEDKSKRCLPDEEKNKVEKLITENDEVIKSMLHPYDFVIEGLKKDFKLPPIHGNEILPMKEFEEVKEPIKIPTTGIELPFKDEFELVKEPIAIPTFNKDDIPQVKAEPPKPGPYYDERFLVDPLPEGRIIELTMVDKSYIYKEPKYDSQILKLSEVPPNIRKYCIDGVGYSIATIKKDTIVECIYSTSCPSGWYILNGYYICNEKRKVDSRVDTLLNKGRYKSRIEDIKKMI